MEPQRHICILGRAKVTIFAKQKYKLKNKERIRAFHVNIQKRVIRKLVPKSENVTSNNDPRIITNAQVGT